MEDEPTQAAAIEIGEHVANAQHVAEKAHEDAIEQVGQAVVAKEAAIDAKDQAHAALEQFGHIPTREEIHDIAAEGARKGATEALTEWELKQAERWRRIEERLDAASSGDVVKVQEEEVAKEPDGPVANTTDGVDAVQDGTDQVIEVVEPPPTRSAPKNHGRYYRI